MKLTVTEAQNGMTLLVFLRRELGFSSKMIKHLKFSPGGILLNGEHVTVRRVLSTGDELTLATEDTENAPIAPVDLPIEILYEDDNLVVPSKPANMPTHPSFDHHYDTVANALAYRYAKSHLPFVFRPINRLDRNTSGLLLVARNRQTAGRLSEAMQKKEIQKTYIAVLDGEMSATEGRINECLHRTRESIIVREVCSPDTPDADPAITDFSVIATGGGHTLVKAHPITGRTHQLRVHFAYIGHPITGDDLYGIPSDEIPRHALHAYTLTFPLPDSGEPCTLTAPIPQDIAKLIDLYFPSVKLS